MLNELDGIVNPTLREKIVKSIVAKLVKYKVNYWLGHPIRTKTVLKFTDKLKEELHKPVSRKFERRRVSMNGIDEVWAADLIDMQVFSKDNKGKRYLLTVINSLDAKLISAKLL